MSDQSSDVVNYLQTIVFKLKINTLSPKDESGYLLPEWVFGGNSSFEAQTIGPKVNLLNTKQRILLGKKFWHYQKNLQVIHVGRVYVIAKDRTFLQKLTRQRIKDILG